MAESRRLSELATAVTAAADLPDGPLVVALSGGADSAALLWVCDRLDRPVRAVHVHHGLEASDAMADAAAKVAEAVGSPCERVDVSVRSGSSPENQARMVRYRALEAALEEGEWLLTAHTSDDQAETFLDHLLRASGLDGLGGIPRRRGRIARPLLDVSRSETRELATLAGLPFKDDPVNASRDPLRNRIRRELIPRLEAEHNPRLRLSLATTARLLDTDGRYLDSKLVPFPEQAEGEVTFPASVLSTAAASPAARLARRFLAAAGLPGASPGAVESVLRVASGDIGKCQPGAGLLVRRRGALVVAGGPTPGQPEPVALAVPGSTRFGPWWFDAEVSSLPPAAAPLGSAWMLADAGIGTLAVEPAADHPEALALLADAGVPAPDRASYPVMQGDRGTVWVPGVRRLGFGWVDATTERYLVVRSRGERR